MKKFKPCFIIIEGDLDGVPNSVDGNHSYKEIECRIFAKTHGLDVIQTIFVSRDISLEKLARNCSPMRSYLYYSGYPVTYITDDPVLIRDLEQLSLYFYETMQMYEI